MDNTCCNDYRCRMASEDVAALDLQDAAEVSQAVRGIRTAAAHVELLLARALEPHQLTPTQYFVLQAMHEVGDDGLRCSELGQKLAGPAPDVTRLLDRLESVGFVSRERDQKDRRAVHGRLTQLGVDALERARPDVQTAEAEALADLGTESRQQLVALLGDVKRRCPNS